MRHLSSVRVGQETIAYTYGTSGNERLRLVKQSSGGNTAEYTHDRFGRVVAEKRSVSGHGTLKYFRQFEKKDEHWHKKWKWITIAFCICSVTTAFLGLCAAHILSLILY